MVTSIPEVDLTSSQDSPSGKVSTCFLSRLAQFFEMRRIIIMLLTVKESLICCSNFDGGGVSLKIYAACRGMMHAHVSCFYVT